MTARRRTITAVAGLLVAATVGCGGSDRPTTADDPIAPEAGAVGWLAGARGVAAPAAAIVQVEGTVLLVDGLANDGSTLSIRGEELSFTAEREPLLGVQAEPWGDRVVIAGDRCPHYDADDAEGFASFDCAEDESDPLSASFVVFVFDPAERTLELVADGLPTDTVVSALVDDHLLFDDGSSLDLVSGEVRRGHTDLPPVLCSTDDGLFGVAVEPGDAEVAATASAILLPSSDASEAVEVDATAVRDASAQVVGCVTDGPVALSVADDGRSQLDLVRLRDERVVLEPLAEPVETNGTASGFVDASGVWTIVVPEPTALLASDGGRWVRFVVSGQPIFQQRHALVTDDGRLFAVTTEDEGWSIVEGRST